MLSTEWFKQLRHSGTRIVPCNTKDNPVRAHKIFYCHALFQKLRISNDIHLKTQSAFRDLMINNPADFLSRTNLTCQTVNNNDRARDCAANRRGNIRSTHLLLLRKSENQNISIGKCDIGVSGKQ